MVKFVVRRLFFMVVTLLLVSVAVFVVSELGPGDIAVNTLGIQITPEQHQSFNAQNGLDQPLMTRYVRWLIGSDWQLSGLIGRPIERVYEEGDRCQWWVVAPDGSLYQNYTPDGEKIIRVVYQEGANPKEMVSPDDQWKRNAQGIEVFWGIDRNGRGAMWVRGENLKSYTLTKTIWTSEPGAPREYIPLQMGLLRGDPGMSFSTGRPVGPTLVRRLINSAILAGMAFVIIMPLALLLGLISGLREGTFIDRLLSTTSLIATATPEFATGVFLILIFSSWLRLLPGAVVIRDETRVLQNLPQLILPLATLTFLELGYVLRMTRASMVEVMRTDYIRTAELKGLPTSRIVFKHAIRNALIAPITMIMLHVNWLVGGLVVVESIFGYPGVGRYVMDSALFKDVFAVEGSTMSLVIIAVVTQLIADLTYVWLNPRIRYT